ncbi:MAG: hypothetical protein FWD03_03555 [Defluviitaleaceae bacterium]|nr:hypothetical protein [Defluviitaleaceae bacterium]
MSKSRLAVFTKLFFVLLIFFGVAVLSGCDAIPGTERRRVREANERIEQAIGRAGVIAGGQPLTLGLSISDCPANCQEHYRCQTDQFSFEDIQVEIDFERLFFEYVNGERRGRHVEENDFYVAREHADGYLSDLYGTLSNMFERTNHLTIIARNLTTLVSDFDVPPELENTRSIPIAMGRFFKDQDKFLRLDTDFGILEIYSDFFFRTTGLRETSDLFLRFTLEDCNEILSLQLIDNNNDEAIDVRNPGKTALLKIPLCLGFMQDDYGNPRFHAVEFIDINNENHGVLPRSFIDDKYLYIYFNRTGRFRLISTPHGNTSNFSDFLSDRDIFINGAINNEYVSRSEFYAALMDIHWVEQLLLYLSRTEPFPALFPDVPRGGRLEVQINTGQHFGVLWGYPDGLFRPSYPLMRQHMFIMLAGNIRAFGYEIDEQMPAILDAIGIPNDEVYWYNEMRYLKNRGFITYRHVEDIADVAATEYVTVEEAREIIYRLIIADSFDR